MIELRDMQILVALARHRHFARAALECGISQPAFSMRIRNLEARLGVPVVVRGNRFVGFTEEGDIVLRRARRMLEESQALEQEIRSATGAVTGTLTVGAVPTALAFAAKAAIPLHTAYPGIVMRLVSASSLQIMQRLEDRSFDAGITYEDGVSSDLTTIMPLYEERYVLITPPGIAPRDSGTVSWEEAAALPLTLLEPQMQNRRILDRLFKDLGHRPRVIAETNAFTASLILAREGFAATIVPEGLVTALGDLGGTIMLPLAEPELTKSICLVVPTGRSPRLTVEALKRTLCPDEQ